MSANPRVQAILNEAHKLIGTLYIYGGNDPAKGIDCSRFAQLCYAVIGTQLPRTTFAQWADGGVGGAFPGSAGLLKRGPKAPAPVGALVYFAGSDGSLSAPGHVGINVGGGLMLNAPYTALRGHGNTGPAAGGVVRFDRFSIPNADNRYGLAYVGSLAYRNFLAI